jgi:hypothetical protein
VVIVHRLSTSSAGQIKYTTRPYKWRLMNDACLGKSTPKIGQEFLMSSSLLRVVVSCQLLYIYVQYCQVSARFLEAIKTSVHKSIPMLFPCDNVKHRDLSLYKSISMSSFPLHDSIFANYSLSCIYLK